MRIGLFARKTATASALAALLLASCSGSDAAPNAQANTQAGTASNGARALPASRDKMKGRAVPNSKPCGTSELERSTCMIELILADLKANYRGIGGGGITSIKAGVGLSYSIALPQEERTDILTYEFEARGDTIAIKNKKESTETYGG